MNILISWVAFNNDFENGKVKIDGPTFSFHQYFFQYDRHIILSAAAGDDTKTELLANKLKTAFPDRKDKIEIKYMDIRDVIDIPVIKVKVEQVLMDLSDHNITIFFSPGTSAMQICWYICHSTLGLNTRLLQLRPAKFGKEKLPELLTLTTTFSPTPVTAIMREEKMSKPARSKTDYIISSSIEPVYHRAWKIAQTDKVTTLITGASGTGKENLAKFIHNESVRKDHPFITINCSAFNDQLLESRLFGYKKGSFTDANKDSKGFFEEASGGTIFLDEIGDISTYMQQSLLRVLQEQEVLPLGLNKPVKIDVRIIAATNRDLSDLCRQGKFRWDLYYRLTVTELILPTLEGRGLAEKNELIDHFLKTKKTLFKRSHQIVLTTEARQALLAYNFPGNIRELENLIEQLYVFFEDKITLADLPQKIINPIAESSLKWPDIEKQHIIKVLALTKGNQRKAFNLLGYGSINTFSKKIKDYDIAVTKY